MVQTPNASGVMDELCAYVASAGERGLPDSVVERTKHHILDSLAAIISGSRLLPGRRAIEWVAAQGGTPVATVVGTSIVTNPVNAALANGMFGHADETDDANFEALIHPGCSIIPASLAMGEEHHASGTAFLRAVTLGYDVAARMIRSLGVERYRASGFSTHSIGPTFGCAAAGGLIAGIDERYSRYLFSYAAQQASGVACWAKDTEHVEKAFDFGGMPARAGVTAATMVAMGFTGVEDVFTADRGFYHAHPHFAQPELLVRGLGDEYEVMNTSIKRWPAGYPVQAPLYGLSTLLAQGAFDRSDVESVRIVIGTAGYHSVAKASMGDIDLPTIVALMLVDGEVSFEAVHDEERAHDPAIVEMRTRIEVAPSDELSRDPITRAMLEIDTGSGGTVRHETGPVIGSPQNPMTRADVEAKCRPLIEPVLGQEKSDRLVDAIWSIEDIDDVAALRPILSV